MLRNVSHDIAQKMDAATLPLCLRQDGRDRSFEAFVSVANDKSDAVETTLDEASHKRAPTLATLSEYDVDADDFAKAVLVDRVGNHNRLVRHTAVLAHLHVDRVEHDVRICRLQPALAEGAYGTIELHAQ